MNNKTEKAAVFLELTLSIPLIILSLTLLAWLGQMLNARSSLTSAVRDSLRLAVTRVNRILPTDGNEKYTVASINAVNEFRTENKLEPISLLLASEEFRQNFSDILQSDYKLEAYSNKLLNDKYVPPELTYALIYLYQFLQIGNSGNIRFPCDPDASDGQGCVQCKFLNPTKFDTVEMVKTIDNPEAFNRPSINDPIPSREQVDRAATKKIAMTCSYRPDSALVNTIIYFMSVITGDPDTAKRFTITSTSAIDLDGGG